MSGIVPSMDTIGDDLTRQLAARLKAEREARGWSLSQLATRAGVSKAMISKIERAEASPTAAMLGKLSGALAVTMSALLSSPGAERRGVSKAADQPTWIDPETGYRRRQVLIGQSVPLELVEVELPAGAHVDMPASSYAFIRQAIWVLDGALVFCEGAVEHHLSAGDSLELGPPVPCRFENRSAAACRYLVSVVRS